MFFKAISRFAIGTAILFSSHAANACNDDKMCSTPGGEYYFDQPDNPQQAQPAVIFLHGFGSSGKNVISNRGLVQNFLDRGYAVIAPNGMKMAGRRGRNWSFHPQRPKARDEIGFLTGVRDHAVAEHGIDPTRIMLSGFSIGGSMASYLACAAPDTFSAYAPVGGNFWRPHPQTCAGPVRLLHTHGWTDGTVPLEGRIIFGSDISDANAWVQGDVFHAMEIWRRTNGCVQHNPNTMSVDGDFWRRKWTQCLPGSALEFMLFPGGHTIP